MNKSFLSFRTFFYGFLIWALPFILAIPIFQIIGEHRVAFKSVMGVIIVIVTILFSNSFLKNNPELSKKQSIIVSLIWIVMSIVPDLFAFTIGFKMQLSIYFSEIAISYLVIPIVLISNKKLVDNIKN